MSNRTVIRTVITPRAITRRVGPAGAGGGSSTFAALTDKATADLPAINGPLGTALSGKAPVSGISPSAITGTAVIATDPRLSDARPPTTHTHVGADISDAATAATPSTLVLRNGSGGASLAGLTLSGTGGSPYTSTLTGGVNFDNRTLVLPDASGTLVVDSSLANSASITASNAVAVNTIVLRDSAGKILISNVDVSGATAYASSASWAYTTPSAATHRTALGSGATGDAIFTAVTPAAARETLGVRTFRTTADVSNSTQTPANGNVPELTFPVVAGKSYKIDFCFILAAAGGSFVHQIKATYPTATLPALGDCLSLHRFTVKVPTPGSTSMDFNTSTAAAATSGVHSGYWFYRPSASGNVTFQIYNYDATAVTNTLKAGTTVTTTEL